MIFDEVAEIMSSEDPLVLSRKTGLSKSKVKRLRDGCPFVMDYNTVFALGRLGYVVKIEKRQTAGREKSDD